MVTDDLNKALSDFRRTLHKYPELSWEENMTAQRVISFLKHFSPDEIISEIAGTGVAFIYRGKISGPRVLVRCELDALPISEINDFKYRSIYQSKSHKCGHDGHMAIIAGLAAIISENRFERGEVVLLFQPAEETGEGAASVISDKAFERIKPDFAFAAHNLPGFGLNSIIIRNGLFSGASKGIVVELQGRTSHASEPEKGLSPALPMARIIKSISNLPESADYRDFVLSTVVFARLGEVALGTSPGYAKIISTLRAYQKDDMDVLSGLAAETADRFAEEAGIKIIKNWIQEFPPTENDRRCVDLVTETAGEKGLVIVTPAEPFRWSEDFGHFTRQCPGAIFGIGSGKQHSALHNPDYDFPEEIISTGMEMFYGIIEKILNG